MKELDKLTKTKELISVSATRIQVSSAQALALTKRKILGSKHVERNAARIKDMARRVPSTLIVQVELERESLRILLDSGCQADLVSSTVVDQLKLQKSALTKPLTLQLAVSGSRGTLHYNVRVRIVYQSVDEYREFDVANIDNYDMILGMSFLCQHSMKLGFNPNSVLIGSPKALPLQGDNIIIIDSMSVDILNSRMDELRELLCEEANDLCKTIDQTPLLPF
jgi:hypothetical protein